MEKRDIAIICATGSEYRLVREALPPTAEQTVRGRTVALSSSGPSFVLVHAMPAKVHCASATQLAVDTFSPRLVLAAGAGGSLDDTAPIGSLVCSELCYEVDVLPLAEFARHGAELTSRTVAAPGPLSRRPILEAFAAALASKQPRRTVRFGNIASAEADVADAQRRSELRAAFGAIACDWESAAVARTAYLNGVEALSLRVITDLAGSDMEEQYRTNRDSCLGILAVAVEELVCAGWGRRLCLGDV